MHPFDIKYLETALVWYKILLELVLSIFTDFVSIWSTSFRHWTQRYLDKSILLQKVSSVFSSPAARRATDGKKGSVSSVLLPACKWLDALLSNPLVVGWTSFSVSYVQIRTCIRLSPGWRGWRFAYSCVGGVRLPGAVVERGDIDHCFGLVESVNGEVRLTSLSCHVWACAAEVLAVVS